MNHGVVGRSLEAHIQNINNADNLQNVSWPKITLTLHAPVQNLDKMLLL